MICKNVRDCEDMTKKCAWDESELQEPFARSSPCIESRSLPRPVISSAAGKAEETVESERKRRNQDGSCVRYNAGFLTACSTHTRTHTPSTFFNVQGLVVSARQSIAPIDRSFRLLQR